MAQRRVVITGMGIVSSIGNDVSEVAASLREGRSGIVRADAYAEHGFRSQVHGAPSVDPAEHVDRRAMRFHGNGTAWLHMAMDQAVADAGLEESDISNERTGLIMGSGGPSTRTIVEASQTVLDKGSPKRIGPFAVPKAMSSTASATIATPFAIKGLNYTITSACSTTNHCIGSAAEQIRWGKQDRIFAGGCEDLDWTLSCLFDAMGAMSSKFNDEPATASRAFSADRDGFVIAGGAGVLVLEEWEVAKARGATILAEIVGYGATSDGADMVAPSGEGAVRCMNQALAGFEGGGIGPVDYINPHATATPVGDASEIGALREVFGADQCPPLSATKSMTGHAQGATGVHEAIYSLLMMRDGFIAPSINITELDPDFTDMPIVREMREAELTTVLSNSFGFGGTNATLAFRRVEA